MTPISSARPSSHWAAPRARGDDPQAQTEPQGHDPCSSHAGDGPGTDSASAALRPAPPRVGEALPVGVR